MPFANGGYYNYERLMYKAGQATPTSVKTQKADHSGDSYYDLQGRRLQKAPKKGLYIQDGQIKMIE